MQPSLSEQLQEAIHGENQPEQEEVAVEETQDPQDQIAEEGSDEHEIRTLADLAEVNEWDAEELYALEMAMPDDQPAIPLGKLKDELTSTRRQSQELQHEYQRQAEQLQIMQQQAGQSQQVDQFVRATLGKIDAIDQFLASPDLQKLKENDPTAAMLKTQEVKEIREKLAMQGDQYWQQQQYQQQMQTQQNMQHARQAIQQGIPQWSDPEVATREKAEIARSFIKYGYYEADVAAVADPRQVMIMRRLNELERKDATGQESAQQVRQSPKRSLRGGRISRTKVQGAAAVARARKTGSKNDVLAAQKAIVDLAGGL